MSARWWTMAIGLGLGLGARSAHAAPSAQTQPLASEAVPAPRGPAQWRQTPPDDPRRFSVAGHFETQLVGLALGLRAEALYRPFRPDRGANLRAGLGLQGGPELAYVPVDLGWRQHFVPHRLVTLELGAGYEQQTFLVPGIRPISRPAVYAEGGLAVRVTPGGWLGAQVVPSWAFVRPGPGLAVRLGFRWSFGRRGRATATDPATGRSAAPAPRRGWARCREST